MNFSHEQIEKNPWLLILLVTLVISIGGAVEIVQSFVAKHPRAVRPLEAREEAFT